MMCSVFVGFTTILQLLYCLDVCNVSGQLALLQAFTRWRHLSTHPIKQDCYLFIDPEG